jgi:hypothetical protein
MITLKGKSYRLRERTAISGIRYARETASAARRALAVTS